MAGSKHVQLHECSRSTAHTRQQLTAAAALLCLAPSALRRAAGKYDETRVPPGPRGLLFRQLLPGIRPLTLALGAVADSRRKSRSQVALNWCICKGTYVDGTAGGRTVCVCMHCACLCVALLSTHCCTTT